jgi:hypothetical protein
MFRARPEWVKLNSLAFFLFKIKTYISEFIS